MVSFAAMFDNSLGEPFSTSIVGNGEVGGGTEFEETNSPFIQVPMTSLPFGKKSLPFPCCRSFSHSPS